MSVSERGTSVNVRLLFFAKTRELAGIEETSIRVQSSITSSELLNTICAANNLEVIKDNIILAVNENYCEVNEAESLNLREGDEIALIPPISGG